MDTSQVGGGSAHVVGPWLCPVDRVAETNGQHPFSALRPCGHVMREAVVRECRRSGSRRQQAAEAAGSGGEGASSLTDGAANQSTATATASRSVSDGVSLVEGARWSCPVCVVPVEVSVRLLPDSDVASKLKQALATARAARKDKKRKRLAAAAEEAE